MSNTNSVENEAENDTNTVENEAENDDKRKSFLILIMDVVVILAGLIALNMYCNKEVSTDAYRKILDIANSCERDICDEIVDSLADGEINVLESIRMIPFQNAKLDSDIENPKQLLIDFVTSDDKFRTQR